MTPFHGPVMIRDSVEVVHFTAARPQLGSGHIRVHVEVDKREVDETLFLFVRTSQAVRIGIKPVGIRTHRLRKSSNIDEENVSQAHVGRK